MVVCNFGLAKVDVLRRTVVDVKLFGDFSFLLLFVMSLLSLSLKS